MRDALQHPELASDAFIGGVYLTRYLDTSKKSDAQPLRDPQAFFSGLMAQLGAAMDSPVRCCLGLANSIYSVYIHYVYVHSVRRKFCLVLS